MQDRLFENQDDKYFEHLLREKYSIKITNNYHFDSSYVTCSATNWSCYRPILAKTLNVDISLIDNIATNKITEHNFKTKHGFIIMFILFDNVNYSVNFFRIRL